MLSFVTVSFSVVFISIIQGISGSPCVCKVAAQTSTGAVCGKTGKAVDGTIFASFLGVPYAKQPLAELRFQELQAADPWYGFLNATKEGPVCPQKDVLFKTLANNTHMSESCIHANIHVPLKHLPKTDKIKKRGLPIVVMTHGGSFAYGSGHSDLYGAEYIMTKDVVYISFNYRINVFGYLTLNSTSIPGNNALRDIITLLKWVKKNAEYFGGDPDDVTLAGQSSGACNVHLLSLSKAGQGLFKRIILMSGVGTIPFYSVTPAYSQAAANAFISTLGIKSTDPEEIHSELIKLDIDTIIKANNYLQDLYGLNVFVPVIEGKHHGVTPIIDEDPIKLLKAGMGKNISAIIGFTNREGEFFRDRFEEINIVDLLNQDATNMLGPRLLFKLSKDEAKTLAKAVKKRYVKGPNVTLDDYLSFAADSYFVRPAIKLSEWRVALDYAPTFLYKFSYNSNKSLVKKAMNLNYIGATHVEDMTYIFKDNALLGDDNFQDEEAKVMIEWMTKFIANFVTHGHPTHDEKSMWKAADNKSLKYQSIEIPGVYNFIDATDREKEMVNFLDSYDTN